jgi:hypothetical protein
MIDHGSRSTMGPGPSRSSRVKARSRRSRPDKVDYWEGVLHLVYIKICLKMIDHDSRSIWGPGPSRSGLRDKKYDPPPTKTVLPYNSCFIKFLPSCTVEAVDALQTLFRTPGPWFKVRARSRRSRPDQVDYWEGALQLLCNKLYLKMIDHGSRSTWGPGPSRSGLWAPKYFPPPLKRSFPTTFV